MDSATRWRCWSFHSIDSQQLGRIIVGLVLNVRISTVLSTADVGFEVLIETLGKVFCEILNELFVLTLFQPFVALFKPSTDVVVSDEACHSALSTIFATLVLEQSTPLETFLANEHEHEAYESVRDAGAVSSRENGGGGCRSNFVHVSGENEWEEDLGERRTANMEFEAAKIEGYGRLRISTSAWEVAQAGGDFSSPAPMSVSTFRAMPYTFARIGGKNRWQETGLRNPL
ncbi:unnamed protein product [Cyclocybe aegerita]|uniref:Uncharacterized protein n=1 Tax=Cyclocybe aegerita TaxID=1973307 RepID=A0A8S0VV39_CYCAE|nr:unnamed protein product [Cyclocybe aegerita]